MDLVVDANVIFAVLIKKSKSEELVFNNDLRLFTPEYFFIEFEEHKEEILSKTARAESEFYETLETLKKKIILVPLEELLPYLQKADEISPDPDDVAYISLALKLNCAIWSQDKILKEKQKIVDVYSTEDLINII